MSEGFEGVAFKIKKNTLNEKQTFLESTELYNKFASALHGCNDTVAILCTTKLISVLINSFDCKEEVYEWCIKVIKEYIKGDFKSNEESS